MPREASVVLEASSAIVDASLDASASEDDIVDAEPFADAKLVDLVSDAIVLLDQAGDIVTANMNNCDTMASRLEDFRETHPMAAAELAAIYKPRHRSELAQVQPSFRARFRAAWRKVQPGIAKCTHSERMKKVIHEVWGDTEPVMPDGGGP